MGSVLIRKGSEMSVQQMHPVAKKRGVDALLSGQYRQGQSCLRNKENKFCCLGVLTDIYSKETGVPWNERPTQMGTEYNFGGDAIVLPSVVQQWAELESENPDTDIERHSSLHYPVRKSLAELNDEGKSFKEIAEIIERCF